MLPVGHCVSSAELNVEFFRHTIVPKCQYRGCAAHCDWSYTKNNQCQLMAHCSAHQCIFEKELKNDYEFACNYVIGFRERVPLVDMLMQPNDRGYMYAVHEHEFYSKGENVVKIGSTRNIVNRLTHYPKNVVLLFVCLVDEYKKCEKQVIVQFINMFSQRTDIGAEYFQEHSNSLENVIGALSMVVGLWSPRLNESTHILQSQKLAVATNTWNSPGEWKQILRPKSIREQQTKFARMKSEHKQLKNRLVGFSVPWNDISGDWVYLIRLRRFVVDGANVIKYGRSSTLHQRLRKYPKGSNVLWCKKVTDSVRMEEHIHHYLLNAGYENVVDFGKEYFRVNLDSIVQEIDELCNRMYATLSDQKSDNEIEFDE